MALSKLQAVIDTFALFSDQADRTNLLLGYADQFTEVPPSVAARPFDKSHQVPACESEAYVWAVPNPDGMLKLHFAVENPSGISAKALATILDKTLSGLPPEQIAQVSPEIVEKLFRQNISMGKGLGLMSMVQAVRTLAARAIERAAGPMRNAEGGMRN
jgi:cysteine desulfuration protein SufE